MGEKTPIIHFSESLATGVLHVVRELANASAERGHPTTVVHGRRPETPSRIDDLFDPRVRLVEVTGFGDRSADGIGGIVRSAWTLHTELRREHAGILHLHSSYAGTVGRLVPSRGWKVFYSPHAYAFLNPARPRAVRSGVRLVEGVLARRGTTIAVSESEGSVARRLASRTRVAVVPNGVAEIGPVAPRRVEGDGPVLVASFGRASTQRRPELFAEVALRFAADPGVRFVWYGEGDQRAALERAAVEVSGWLTHDQVLGCLANVDVVLHLSFFEGLPLSLLESMRAAKAILASDIDALREVGGDAVVYGDDAASLERELRALVADSARRQTLGALAAARVADHYTVEEMVAKQFVAYGFAEPEPARSRSSLGGAQLPPAAF